MTTSARRLLKLISEIAAEDDSDVTLRSLAPRAGWSACHFQRRFKRLAGETPKRFAERVRLDRAAADLLATRASILAIALDAGFGSHEGFARAFQRRFGRSPRQFRQTVRLSPGQAARQRAMVRSVSPCLGLYRVSLLATKRKGRMSVPSIERRVLETEQPILFIRRRVPFADLQQAMGESFGALYGHGQATGLPIAGQPIARFVAAGTGLWTVDLAMPLAAPGEANGEMQAGTLAAGPVAFAEHRGSYDTLPQTNAAIERWIEDNGFAPGGPPWECYVTDPGETPDPADWRTDVYWPLAS